MGLLSANLVTVQWNDNKNGVLQCFSIAHYVFLIRDLSAKRNLTHTL